MTERCKRNPCCGDLLECKPPPQFRDREVRGASGLSAWPGWDASHLPWSAASHQNRVCNAVFGGHWSMEDAATLIGFIEKTWAVAHGSSAEQLRRASSGAVDLLIKLYNEGALSEGQVAKATGLHRIDIRRRADEMTGRFSTAPEPSSDAKVVLGAWFGTMNVGSFIHFTEMSQRPTKRAKAALDECVSTGWLQYHAGMAPAGHTYVLKQPAGFWREWLSRKLNPGTVLFQILEPIPGGAMRQAEGAGHG